MMIEAQDMDTIPINGTWQLPERWEWIQMQNLVHLDTRTINPSDTPETVFLYLGLENIEKGQWDTASYQSLTGKEIKSSCILFDTDHVLYAKLRPNLNKVVVPTQPGIGSTEWLPLYPDPAKVNRQYLAWYFRSPAFVTHMINSASGTRMPRVQMNTFWASPIPIPFPRDPSTSLDIQHRVAYRIESLFADLRDAQSTLKSMRQDIDQVVNSLLLEIFAHTRDGFRIVNVPPEEIKEITKIAQIERGKFTPRPRNDPRFFGGSIPWVQIQNLPKDKGEKYITSYMNTLNDLGLNVSRMFRKGTLVLSIAATIGALGVLTFDACFPDSLVGITPDSNFIDSGFLYWQLVFLQEYLEQIAPSAAQKNINLKILEQIELWVPSLRTQALINVHLDASQEGIARLHRMAEEDKEILQQVEQSILERAFRGEL